MIAHKLLTKKMLIVYTLLTMFLLGCGNPETPYRATCVIRMKDKILLSRVAPNVYSLPGGHIMVSESPASAAQRELYEETGLDVIVGKPHGYDADSMTHSFTCNIVGERRKPLPSKEAPSVWLKVAKSDLKFRFDFESQLVEEIYANQ